MISVTCVLAAVCAFYRFFSHSGLRRAEITVCVDRTVRDDDRRLALNMDLLQTCSPVQEICYLQFGPCYMRTCVLSDRSRSLASWHNDESYLRSTQRQGSAEASDA